MKSTSICPKARMPPIRGIMRGLKTCGRLLPPLWKLNYHIWECLAWLFLMAGLLEMVTGWFPFLRRINMIAFILQVGAAGAIDQGTERYLTRHRQPQFVWECRCQLALAYLVIVMIWLNVWLGGLYWENGVTALLYIGGRWYLERKGR